MLTEFLIVNIIIVIISVLVYLHSRSPLGSSKPRCGTSLHISPTPKHTNPLQNNPNGITDSQRHPTPSNRQAAICGNQYYSPNTSITGTTEHTFESIRSNQGKPNQTSIARESTNRNTHATNADKPRGKWSIFNNFYIKGLFERGQTSATDLVIANERREDSDNEFIKSILMQSKLYERIGQQQIYKLNVQLKFQNPQPRVRKYEFGKPRMGPFVIKEKVILLLGATGSGKTTLINSMINYVLGVEYEDAFRFKLITEDDEGKQNQAHSQTTWITAYTIHHQKGFKVDYTLTIVDTPGFGDTRGVDRDNEITKQVHNFFTAPGIQGIDHVDVVGFVAQSSFPRLNHTQRYIFDRILSLFGKNIGENIYLMLTFADGKVPQVMAGIQEAHLPYKEYFKFNNSVIFEEFSSEDEISRMFWKMGMQSFKSFFNYFPMIFTKSLRETKEVIMERERIETQIEGLQCQVKLGISKLEQLKTEAEIVMQHENDIARNLDFTYVVQEDTVVKKMLEPNTYVTNCMNCNFTCHLACAYPDDGEKYKCAAMEGLDRFNTYCKACPKRCHWSHHKSMHYYFTTKSVLVTKDSQYLKKRYQAANGRVKSAKQIVEHVGNEYKLVQDSIVAITGDLSNSINKLNKLALKPTSLSTSEYVHILIESEKSAAKPGWQERVKHLTMVKEKVENPSMNFEWDINPFERVEKPQEVGGYLGIPMTKYST